MPGVRTSGKERNVEIQRIGPGELLGLSCSLSLIGGNQRQCN